MIVLDMVNWNNLEVSFPPAILTAAVASVGFSFWIRFRKGYFPRVRHVAYQFVFSLTATMIISHEWLDAQKRNKDALRRMMSTTEKRIEIRSKSADAIQVPVEEFDAATGVNAETETFKLLSSTEKSSP